MLENAKWIGSPKPSVNTDVLMNFEIYTEFKIISGTQIGLALCARDKDNYLLLQIDTVTKKLTALEYSDNERTDGIPSVKVRGEGCLLWRDDDFNSLRCVVNKGFASVFVNDEIIICGGEIIPKNIPNQPLRSSLMRVGIKQDGIAVFKTFKIGNPATGDIYQDGDFEKSALSALGTVKEGMLCAHSGFNLTDAVPSVNLRKIFDVTKPVKSARLYTSARGFYNVYLNGEKVGKEYFAPGFTDYRKRIYVSVCSVNLKQGKNSLGAIVAKGYWSGFVGYSGAMIYGRQNSFIARLEILYDDGTTDIVVTDESWQFTERGQIISSDYQQGEFCDARLAFDFNDIEDDRWSKCAEIVTDTTVIPTNGTLQNERFELTQQTFCGAVKYCEISPISSVRTEKGSVIFDFGQNLVGIVKVKFFGKCGQTFKINYAEMLQSDDRLYTENLRTAANTDIYVCRGDENGETFEMSFTAHGFRYAEISGDIKNDTIREISAVVLTNVIEDTGFFECSNGDINRLQKNIEWGQRGNSLLVFTDCPQRNERMGWTGDIGVFAKTAAYNADVREFAKKWLTDLRDAQIMYNKDGAVPDTAPLGGDNRPTGGCGGWGDAAVIVPWEMYLAYGDIGFLEDNYDMMKRWVDYQSTRENYGARTVCKKEAPSDISDVPYIQVQQSRGDHLAYDRSTPFILSATAYAAHSADLLSRAAKILGKDEDSEKYRRRFENIKRAFNSAWVTDDGGIAYWGEQSIDDTDENGNVINRTRYEENTASKPSQTAYALAIDFELIPKNKKTFAYFADSIADDKLSVGFLGISHLIPALVKAGYAKKAFALLEQTENPSWLYSVKNGATTIWERWNSYTAETQTFGNAAMNSFNHYAYGAVGEWLFGGILGIQTSEKYGETGYRRIILKPTFGGTLTYARGYFKSVVGKISSEWEIQKNKFIYRCEIPKNSSAVLYMPGDDAECLSGGAAANGENTFELSGGKYEFSSNI